MSTGPFLHEATINILQYKRGVARLTWETPHFTASQVKALSCPVAKALPFNCGFSPFSDYGKGVPRAGRMAGSTATPPLLFGGSLSPNHLSARQVSRGPESPSLARIRTISQPSHPRLGKQQDTESNTGGAPRAHSLLAKSHCLPRAVSTTFSPLTPCWRFSKPEKMRESYSSAEKSHGL